MIDHKASPEIARARAEWRAEADARLAEVEAQRRERLERMAVDSRLRRDAQLAKAAEIVARAERAPSRQILGACWLCGSKDIPEGLSWLSLPLPLGRIDGSTCAKCRGVRGDMAQAITDRLWQERPALLESWGWKRPKVRPDPYDKSLTREQRAEIIEGIETGQYRNESWSVASEWWRLTWAHHLLEWRREHHADTKTRREPRPSKPFGWLK